MDAELKGKFDDLDDLLSGGYISKEEFATARENLLIEAGFDVSPRTGGFMGGLAFRKSEEERGNGCGCLLTFLLLVALMIGAFLALPEGILKGIPVVGNLIEGQGIQEMRQSVARFIDDLRGNPAPDAKNERVEPETEIAEPGKTEETEIANGADTKEKELGKEKKDKDDKGEEDENKDEDDNNYENDGYEVDDEDKSEENKEKIINGKASKARRIRYESD